MYIYNSFYISVQWKRLVICDIVIVTKFYLVSIFDGYFPVAVDLLNLLSLQPENCIHYTQAVEN